MSEYVSNLRRIAAKAESIPGSAETLTTANNDCSVWDLAIGSLDVPFDEDPSKYATGDFGMGESIPGPTSAQVTFRTKFVNNPTAGSVEPHWTKFAKAAGQTVASYDGVLGSGWIVYPKKENAENTLTIGLYDLERGASPSGLFYQFAGCIGNCTIATEGAGKPYNMSWEFTGGLNDINDVTEASIPELSGWQTDIPDRFLNGFFTIGGVSGCISTMEFAFGNTISPVECVGAATGFSKYGITAMEPMLTINPLVTRIATKDYWGNFTAGTIQAIVIETAQFRLEIDRGQIVTMAVEDSEGILRNKIGIRPLRTTTSHVTTGYAPYRIYCFNTNAT
jgi:hypothetical protein